MSLGCSVANTSTLTAADYRNALIQEQGRLLTIVQQSIDEMGDPYLKLLSPSRKPYQFGMGEGQTTPILRNTVPSDLDSDNQWDTVRPQGIFQRDTNPCCTDPQEIRWGWDYRRNCLKQWSFKTPRFCVVDMQYKFELERQLGHIKNILANVSKWFWRNWLRLAYRQNIMHFTFSSGHIQAGTLPGTEGNFLTNVFPDRFLSPFDLPYLYEMMHYDGAESGCLMRLDGAPIFGMICSPETEWALTQADPRFREQINYSWMGNQMGNPLFNAVSSMGANRRFYNFMPIVDKFPRRFNNVAGTLTQVKSHIEVQAVDGVASYVNPDWKTAEFEEVVFFNAKVMDWLVPAVSGVSALGLPAQSYTGDIQAIVPPRGDHADPLQKNMYFLAEFMAGIEPMFPEYAFSLLIKRAGFGLSGICPDVCRPQPQPSSLPVNDDGILIIDATFTVVEGQLLIFTQETLPSCAPSNPELVASNGTVVPVTIVSSDTALNPKRYVVAAVNPAIDLNPVACGGYRAIRCPRTVPAPSPNPDCDCD